MSELRLYAVTFSTNPEKGAHRWNKTVSVVTTGVIRAAEVVQEENPNVNIWNVVHKGNVDLIDRQ